MHTTTWWVLGRLLDDHDVLALGPLEAQLGDRAGAVGQQPGLVLGVDPGVGHHLGPVHGADVLLVVLDEPVHHLGVDQAPLDQDRLQGLGAQGDGQALGVGLAHAHRHAHCGLQVGLVQVDDEGERLGVGAPQLGGLEGHRVDVLGVLAQEVGVGLGQHHGRLDDPDLARPPPHVPGQAGVARRVDVLGPDPVAHRELRAGRRSGGSSPPPSACSRACSARARAAPPRPRPAASGPGRRPRRGR